ncbi:MAG: hypothetical protein RSA65_05395 [Clostridia bacterium]
MPKTLYTSLESDIRAAVAFAGLPCAASEYTGTESAYMVVNYSTFPANHADGDPQAERQLVQLHLYCPSTRNTAELRTGIKRAIHAAGYSYPAAVDMSDKTGQHIVFEFEGLDVI